MRIFIFIFFSMSLLFGFEKKITLQLGGVAYNNYANELLAQGKGEFHFENELFTTDANVEFLYSSRYTQRRYLLLNELYIVKDFEEYSIRFGKEIKYFGELEGYNIADFYNQKNYLKDPFDKSAKYGTLGIDITRYFEDNSITFGMKLYEDEIPYPQHNTPYAPFQLSYDESLHVSDKKGTPTPYMIMNFVNDTFVESETQLIFLRGYDTKRSFVFLTPNKLSQYAYRVNKALLLSHIIFHDTIYKTELAYTDILDESFMSNYTQLSFGIEKSFYDFYGSDLTFYGEYYRYLYSDDTKMKNIDISEIYDDDIFLALRFALNDVSNSEIKVGLLQDTHKKERVLKVEAKKRLLEKFVVQLQYLNIFAKTDNTLLHPFDNANRLNLSLSYTF